MNYGFNMGKLDVIEENSQLVFHSIENHDFSFITSIGPVSVLQFISKVVNIKYLFISDDISIVSRFKETPYQTSVYDQRFSVAGSSWITYDLALYLISEDHKFLELFDFVIFDGISERQLDSDFVLSLILNLQLKGKFIIPIESDYNIDKLTDYIQSFGYSSNILNFFPIPTKNIYYMSSQPENIHTEMIKTIDDIFKIDQSSNSYDVLVIVSHYSKIGSFKTQLLDTDLSHDFSILTDISSYNSIGAHRRIIITTTPSRFVDIDHRIRYIVDSGIVRTPKIDACGLEFHENKLINRTIFNNRLTILQNENSNYFAMFGEESIVDYDYGMDRCFLVHLIYLLKSGLKINEFKFFKSPNEELIRISINFGIHIGILIIEDDVVKLTELGSTVSKFQIGLNISSLSLFTALSYSNRFNCTKELLKISAVLLSVNVNSLSKDLDVCGIEVPDSDFLTLLNIFNTIIDNEQYIKRQYNIREINKDSKRQILHCYKQLKTRLNYSINQINANEDDIHKSLFHGYQLHCGFENVSNGQSTLKPIKKLDQDELKFNLLINKSFNNNDIIIFHNCEYILLYISIICYIEFYFALC